MDSALRLDDEFSIVAEESRSVIPHRVLKFGDSFGVFDSHGDIAPAEAGEQGLYHGGTRYLSRLQLLLGRVRPLLLSSTVSDDNAVFTADSTNPDVRADGRIALTRGEIHVFRSRVLCDGGCVERIRVSNYALHPVDIPVSVEFDADFADVFEVRGTRRARRGERRPDITGPEVTMRYRGLDGIDRETRIAWSRPPDIVKSGLAMFRLSLDPHASIDIGLRITYREAKRQPSCPATFDEVVAAHHRQTADRNDRSCQLLSSSESFNRWVSRSAADLQMMITDTPNGLYPYAGIPWFSTPFGRDGLIAAFELLWANPAIARGVLAFLAATQATEDSPARDAQPGKILHEMRGGEMAALDEIPFGRYYGSADATPLFVMLADAYYDRTGDRAFLDHLRPHILAALDWMRLAGDPDGDGFIEYSRQSATGLVQQGWKDSNDSVFHADGALAEPPIALCEIQGYAYAAWLGAARLASMWHDERHAAEWRERAERLRAAFDKAFWCEELGTYALALDGAKRPCRVRSSNAAHCLFAGIATSERASQICRTLMEEASFAGWGVRTIAAGEARYNPMSYHNGSIWPHDNAIAAAGLARYGFTESATRVLHAMFDLSQTVDLHRLPELICGFHRRGGEQPTLYPVACAPQAWAAGAVYLLVESCLGLRVNALARRVSFTRAALPEGIKWLQLSNLAVGDARVDLLLERHPHDVGVTVLRREGEVEIVGVK
jgi:glycogen debranching enzyme